MRFACMLIPVALAACGHRTAHEETQTTVTRDGATTTTITNRDVDRATARSDTVSGLKIDSEQFKANVEIPGISFGGDHMNLDGLKLYPGSTVKGVRVHAVDRPGTSKGEVTMNFTSPAAPVMVAQHMADQARHAGFTLDVNTTLAVRGASPTATARTVFPLRSIQMGRRQSDR